MKKIVIIGFLVMITTLNQAHGNDKVKTFSKKVGYELYKQRVENFCREYKDTDESSELIYSLDESSYFKNIQGKVDGTDLTTAVKDYRNNMDSLYTCATSISFKRQLQLIKRELINKSPKLNAKFKKKLEKNIQRVEQKVKKLKGNCKINTDSNNSIIKKSILRQSSYELCKYNFYLEYLKNYNENNIQNLGIEKGTSIEKAVRLDKEKQSKIEGEIEKAYRAFPLVFQAYSDFENNIGTHVLLELLQVDFALFREELHKTLHPINQVVYKISNAMRK